ncbi:hypothetical protein EJ05DRAFT_251351 [Pseudovirgaria hyperparasitica]|uniref:Uncharacterized protein n=1 Tax=Pseudovirgaria hyperparasitica TaxID=470096 RepID=A0A6A6WG92_9PEZI|nr:uncharacterized protein EJ05DRAFT_251351 [Pseudovirgaria hyperparasitica]KAF2761060.1 hypothetical protein EJ05DRAFT_251351 [Pseudovirgaria hyperparasitica]
MTLLGLLPAIYTKTINDESLLCLCYPTFRPSSIDEDAKDLISHRHGDKKQKEGGGDCGNRTHDLPHAKRTLYP